MYRTDIIRLSANAGYMIIRPDTVTVVYHRHGRRTIPARALGAAVLGRLCAEAAHDRVVYAPELRDL